MIADDLLVRMPPHSIDAEQAVLGGLMLVPTAFAKISDWLGDEDFYRRDHGIIFRAIKQLLEANKPVDHVTMMEWFDSEGMGNEIGGSHYILQLLNGTASAANIVAYAEIVLEKSRLRKAIDIGTTLANAAFSARASSESALSDALNAITRLQGASNVGGLQTVKPGLRRMFEAMEERYTSGPRLLGLATPWAEVNALTKGLRPGVVYVVAGRPSMGKSIFANQLAAFCAIRGARTAVFSPEMGESEVLQRMAASVSSVPHEWIEQPTKTDPNEDQYWSALTTGFAELGKSPLLVDDTPAIRIEQLMARARREHMRSPLGLIVTDHIHDMGTDPKSELRTEMGRIVQGHKTLAKEMHIPVVVMAQLNRNLSNRTDKRPVMTDLRESGEIEQKADVIMFLHREDYYDEDTHMKDVVELIPRKGRNLRIAGPIILANRFAFMRMDDWIGLAPKAPDVPQQARKVRRGFDGKQAAAAA